MKRRQRAWLALVLLLLAVLVAWILAGSGLLPVDLQGAAPPR
ncbi:hypothetical protein [Pseudofulvimonas gallinarii]|nr:hypothetical protein [Pseudofulvimonas gallinarii]